MQEQQVAAVEVLGLDLGGAGLKAADARGRTAVRRFPLWRQPEGLAAALAELAAPWRPRTVALAMTGELCDCFRTKAEGVARILDAVAAAFPHAELRVWSMPGGWFDAAAARAAPWSVAASNYHALATWAARFAGAEPALLIDVGSTTTDLVPLVAGAPRLDGYSDPERLRDGTLLYHGVERTPLCAVRRTVFLRGREFRLANEVFAAMRDAYVLLGALPEAPDDRDTADGRPATRAAAAARLARMIAADETWLTPAELLDLARQFAAAQAAEWAAAAAALAARQAFGRVLWCGQGEALAAAALAGTPLGKLPRWSLAAALGPELSRVAPAYALAVLASER